MGLKGEPQGKRPLPSTASPPPASVALGQARSSSCCPEATPGQPPSQALGDVQTGTSKETSQDGALFPKPQSLPLGVDVVRLVP